VVVERKLQKNKYSKLNALQAEAFNCEWNEHDHGVQVAAFIKRKLGGKRGEIANFARAVGVTPGHITNVMKGRRLPKPKILAVWAPHLTDTETELSKFLEMIIEDHIELAEEEIRDLIKAQRREIAVLREKLAELDDGREIIQGSIKKW
jgi:transcriptional regulator with XRE-family HTH domain